MSYNISNRLFSIIIPAYNPGCLIVECLQSIFSNIEQYYEVIIIDDGSTDLFIEKVKVTFSSQIITNKLTVFRQENQGVSVARNKGIELAKGDYLCFIDADDYVSSNYISTLSEIVQSFKPDIIEFGYSVVNGGSISSKKKNTTNNHGLYHVNDVLEDFYAQSVGYSWIRCFKRDSIKDIQFPEGVRFCEDLMFCVDVMSVSNSIYILPDPLYFYRINNNSATLNVKPDYKEKVVSYAGSFYGKYNYGISLFKVNLGYVCYRCDYELNQTLELPFRMWWEFKLAAFYTFFDPRISYIRKAAVLFPYLFRVYQKWKHKK